MDERETEQLLGLCRTLERDAFELSQTVEELLDDGASEDEINTVLALRFYDVNKRMRQIRALRHSELLF